METTRKGADAPIDASVWLAELGRAHGQGAPTLAGTVATLCADYPQDAKRVYARLRSWGGPQAAKYRLRHKVAGLIAREIARRLSIPQDDIRPARRDRDRELREFWDWCWGQDLRYDGACNMMWSHVEEWTPGPVRQYTQEEVDEWNESQTI